MAELIKEHKLPNFTPFQILGRKKRCQKKIEINGIEILTEQIILILEL